MIWAILDVCAIRFQLSILFHCFIDLVNPHSLET
jgi:predicted nucleotidyltransferase